jgi:hypothetical protein
MRILLPVFVRQMHEESVLVLFVVFENNCRYTKSNDCGKRWYVSKEEVSDSCNT